MLQAMCDPAFMEEGELGHSGVLARLPRGGGQRQLEQKLRFPSETHLRSGHS